jgi:hypothetical protein
MTPQRRHPADSPQGKRPTDATGKKSRPAPEIWVVGLVAVVVILLVLFSLAL